MEIAIASGAFVFIVAIATVLPFLAIFLVRYILTGIAFTRLTKEKPFKHLWLIWVPVWGELIARMYMMAHLSNETETRMFCGKLVFKRKIIPWRIYFIMYILSLMVSGLGSVVILIPVIGTISVGLDVLVLILATIWLWLVEYAYLRDLLNTYRPDDPTNDSTALKVTIGSIFTLGIVRAIYFFRLSKQRKALLGEENEQADENAENEVVEAQAEEIPVATEE